MTPHDMTQMVIAAGRLHGDGRLAEAEALYRQILAADPRRIDASCGLGLIASQTGRHAEALRYLPWEYVVRAGNPLVYVARSASLLATQGFAAAKDAAACARRAIEIAPTFSDAHNNLGCALQMQGSLPAAAEAFRAALQLRPDYPEALFNLGRTLYDLDQLAHAVAAYRMALGTRPAFPAVLFNLGFALRKMGQLDDAAACFRQAASLQPGFSEAMHNLGVTLAEKGQVLEAAEWHQKALAAKPDNIEAHSGLMYLLTFHPGYDSAAIAAEAARWNARHAAPLLPGKLHFANEKREGRRLRVGYVSPDFYAHAQCRFTLPFFEQHDHAAFDIHCYSSVRRPDDITQRIRRCADAWHEVRSLGDAALAEKIRADNIDILVDLSMHMEDNRLLVFARKPAPVQITWLAYPTCPGLAAIDYRITDQWLDPPDVPDGFPEKPLYIADLNCCYHPVTETPDVRPLPALTEGRLTFGSLNNFRKMSPPVLALWADVLRETGDSRLVMLCPEGDHRRGVIELFESRGVDRSRVTLVRHLPGPEYLQAYHAIDIGLDPLPYNGITTTLDALWMGVPVLTLRGNTPPGRASTAILQAMGLGDWVAQSDVEFVRKAVDFARRHTDLARLRTELRRRLAESPVLNAAAFARKMENAYQRAWNAWLTSGV